MDTDVRDSHLWNAVEPISVAAGRDMAVRETQSMNVPAVIIVIIGMDKDVRDSHP